jgi:aspartyl-tRNA(Asn)/glutamyl-tRNA(Gln) amidotransferase subunit A
MASTTADRELAFTPVYKLTEMIRKKKLSPVELMEVILKRIKELNPKLNAYLTLAEESALEGARHAEKALSTGEKLGPLHGIPTSIKDLVATKGIRTTSGSLVYKDVVPETEGTMVKRLKAAGAIIVGKTNTPEFGLAACTDNRLGDSCRNPWNLERTSGGSSGGAAAGAAAGISPLSQGSDGGGSVRIPAAYCGLYGLKPNYGRVPKDVAPWGVSHISCTGPLTWTVRDTALMMNVISGPDGLDYTCIRTPPPDYVKALDTKPKRLKIAWSPDLGYGPFGVKVDPEVKAAVEKAVKVFAEMGHSVEEATPTPIDPFDTWDVLINSRNFIPYGSLLEKHADKLMEYTKTALECGRDVSGVEVAKSWVQVEKMRGVMLDFFAQYDLLLTPCTAVPAPKVGQKARELGRHFIDWPFHPFTPVFNLTLNPAAAIPCGFTADGLPISLQMVGRLEDEVTVLRASAAFEEARPWANKRPPIS